MDRYGNAAVAVTVAAARATEGSVVLARIGSMAAATGFVLASYVTKEYELRHGRRYPSDVLAELKKRDLRLAAVAVGAVLGSPNLAAVAVGVLSHLCVLGVLSRG